MPGRYRALVASGLMDRSTGRQADVEGVPDDGRGRRADSPQELTKSGWRDVLLRTQEQVKSDNVPIVAAGVAFWSMLAVIPSLIALVSLYGLVSNPADVEAQLRSFTSALPVEARRLLEEQLLSIVTRPSAGLSVGLFTGLGAVLLTASNGMKALITGVNVAYDEPESRGYFKLRATALLFTIAAIGLAVVALGFIIALPAVLRRTPLGDASRIAISVLRWPLLALLVVVGLSLLYRYGPDREEAKWRWVSWGAVVATVLWLVGSALFAVYANNFGSYNETYGTLGGVIVLMLWLFVTAFAVLFGAELNSEMEHQTVMDTTTGPSRSLGTRQAFVADTVGAVPARGRKKGGGASHGPSPSIPLDTNPEVAGRPPNGNGSGPSGALGPDVVPVAGIGAAAGVLVGGFAVAKALARRPAVRRIVIHDD